MLSPASTPAQHLALLGWLLIGIACTVIVLVTIAILLPLRRRQRSLADTPPTGSAHQDEGRSPIIASTALSAVILLGAFVATVATLAATASPPGPPALAIAVTGHQWWWDVEYQDADVARTVRTANEIHVPVGQPVRLAVQSIDVVHSFWVPALQGKIDIIPGQTNVFWIEADRPGTYRGQCAKYCGMQHANMRLSVIADPPQTFATWLDQQRRPAAPPADSLVRVGQTAFVSGPCAFCHTIRGTEAAGRAGPDLTHLAARHTIAAGTLENTSGNLYGWVADAPGIKPGTLMPRLDLDPRTLQALVAYLRTLN